MRKVLLSSAVAVAALFALTGCGAAAGPVGMVYTDVSTPDMVTQNAGAQKEGKSQCTSILSIVATGDCSVAAAAANGGIRQIQSVDTHTTSILGIYSTYTTIVKGQ